MIGEKIKNLRIQKGMSQEDLSKELFVSRSVISKWEIGKGIPDSENLKKICDYFDVTVDFLCENDVEELAESKMDKKHIILKIFSISFYTFFIAVCSVLIVKKVEKNNLRHKDVTNLDVSFSGKAFGQYCDLLYNTKSVIKSEDGYISNTLGYDPYDMMIKNGDEIRNIQGDNRFVFYSSECFNAVQVNAYKIVKDGSDYNKIRIENSYDKTNNKIEMTIDKNADGYYFEIDPVYYGKKNSGIKYELRFLILI